MNSITPKARHHQQSQVKQQKASTSRQTRQLDSSGRKRQTNNSNHNKTLLQIDNYPVPTKKKQKHFNESNTDDAFNVNNEFTTVVKPFVANESFFSSNQNNIMKPNSENLQSVSEKMTNKTTISEHYEAVNITTENLSLKENSCAETENSKIKIVKTPILGMGHLSILHAYIRDDLFRDIKILSSNHLETNGSIMIKCLRKLNVPNGEYDNKIAFINEVRSEIRKTMCSRRGYVKRQIGILLTGKFFYNKFRNCQLANIPIFEFSTR